MRHRTGTRSKRRTHNVTKKVNIYRKKGIVTNAQNISLLTTIGRPITFFLILFLKLVSLFVAPPPIHVTASKNFLRLFKQHLSSKIQPPRSSIFVRLSSSRPRFPSIPSIAKPISGAFAHFLNTQYRFFYSRFKSSILNFKNQVVNLALDFAHRLSQFRNRMAQSLVALFLSLSSFITSSLKSFSLSFLNFLDRLRQAFLRLLRWVRYLPATFQFWFLTRTFHLRRQLSQLRLTLSLLLQSIQTFIRHRLSFLKRLIHQFIHFLSLPFIRFYLSEPVNRFHQTLTKHRRVHFSLVIFLVALASSASLTYYFYQEIIKDLPNPAALITESPNLSTKIFDRHGNLLSKFYKNENRSLVTLNDIPITLQLATIAIEDQDFYEHSGISLPGIVRALKVNSTTKRLEGGSTITQQLIKNTLLTPERTLARKTKEVILSILTEFYFSKDEILAMYFNQVPYGGATYGIQEAARMYFHKEVSELNLAESAFLAGLPAAPTYYSPYGTQPELAFARQKQVLRRMVEEGYISQDQALAAAIESLQIYPHQIPIYAPHFVMYVKDYLVNRYGHRLVEQGGLEVTTSLDLDVQNQVQQIVSEEVNRLLPLNVKNGAALVTIPKTGEVLAMIGSVNYFDSANDGQVNVTLRQRQPGSSIKPINYAMALENGFTPATLIPDTPICYHQQGSPDYCPKNYDGRYHGNVTLRSALANSYNIPAVKTLFQFGVSKMLDKANLMGITTWEDSKRYGLALTLGGGDVKMADMAVAYGAFSNLGVRVDLNPILEIKDAEGKIIYTSCHTPPHIIEYPTTPCPGTRALDPRVAYQITDILSDNQARQPAFGSHSVLEIPNHQVAVKTGTTNSMRDNWTIGYTQEVLVATWVGNNDNSPMSYIASGITGASPIWNKIITRFLDDKNPHAFAPPGNLAKVNICTLTGTLACNGCPSKEEFFLPGTEPKTSCSPEHIARLQSQQPPTN